MAFVSITPEEFISTLRPEDPSELPRHNSLHSWWIRSDGALLDAHHHTEFAERMGETIESLLRARWLRINISPLENEILVQGRVTAATRATLDALRFSQRMAVVDDDGRIVLPKPEDDP